VIPLHPEIPPKVPFNKVQVSFFAEKIAKKLFFNLKYNFSMIF